MAAESAARFTTGHVGLNVTDLERSKRFYQAVFGFRVLHESKQTGKAYAFLGQGATPILTLWQQSKAAHAVDRAGLHHLAFEVGSIEEVEDAQRRLRDLGVAIHHDGIVPHADGADSGGVYFDDPDGIRLEIFTSTGAGKRAAPSGAAPTCGFF
jgi:lactoylglutathione lyase